MPATRVCTECAKAKSVNGVWYLVPGPTTPTSFVCGSCFTLEGELLDRPALFA